MIAYALKARKFFPLAPRRQAARQAVAYAKAVEYLGSKWRILHRVERLETPRPV